MTNPHVVSKFISIIIITHSPIILVTYPAEDIEVLQSPILVLLGQMFSDFFPQSYTFEITSLAFNPGKVGQVVHVPWEDNILVGVVAVVLQLEVSKDIIIVGVKISFSHRTKFARK